MKVCNARENLVSHKGKQSDMTFVINKLWGWIPFGSRLKANGRPSEFRFLTSQLCHKGAACAQGLNANCAQEADIRF
jgi:hypothetical protein